MLGGAAAGLAVSPCGAMGFEAAGRGGALAQLLSAALREHLQAASRVYPPQGLDGPVEAGSGSGCLFLGDVLEEPMWESETSIE